MPRPKHGLGQGLDALVSSHQRAASRSEADAAHSLPPGMAIEPPATIRRWEYACLAVRRTGKKRKRMISLKLSYPEVTLEPKAQRIHGVDAWTALGLLGAQGWELVNVRGRSFYLKRGVVS